MTEVKMATLTWSLDVECPQCKKEIDLTDQDDESYFSGAIFNNHWASLKGETVYCEDCDDEFLLSGVEC